MRDQRLDRGHHGQGAQGGHQIVDARVGASAHQAGDHFGHDIGEPANGPGPAARGRLGQKVFKPEQDREIGVFGQQPLSIGPVAGAVLDPEDAAIAALYALFFATVVYRKLSFGALYAIIRDAVRSSGVVGLITPPSGVLLFVINALTGIPLKNIIREIWPYLAALILALIVMALVPAIVLWLPRIFGYRG